MTERLSTLLHEEAALLEIPAPPSDAVLQQGRGLRRRRRALRGAAAFVAVAVVGTGSLLALDREGGSTDAAGADRLSPGAFAVGRTVHLGGADAPTATLDEDVHSLHYTSAGVLVRTNLDGGVSDGSGPEHFTLVRADGTTRTVDLTLEDVVPGTDPDQPYLAWAEPRDGGFRVVVLDVTSDEPVAEIDLPATVEKLGWSAPPVALDGDTVYVGALDGMLAVDWRTGEIRPERDIGGGIPTVAGGHVATTVEQRPVVMDLASGEVRVAADPAGYGWFQLSPDGRFALLFLEEGPDPEKPWELPPYVEVWEVATGSTARVDIPAGQAGWGPDGQLFQLDGDRLVTCDPRSGACEAEASGVGPGELTGGEGAAEVRLGGLAYES